MALILSPDSLAPADGTTAFFFGAGGGGGGGGGGLYIKIYNPKLAQVSLFECQP